MKKSLSLLVAIAMVFSMFATVIASAAEETKLTTQQKYEALVKAGIFEGFPNGQAKLDEKMERSQAAKIVALLLGYKEGVEVKDAGFKDVDVKGQRWAIPVINYAVQLGVLEGHSATRFGPADKVTVEELAQIVVNVAKHAGQELAAGEAVEGKTSKWAAEVVASVVKAGIIPTSDDYTVDATRGQLVDVTYPLYEMTKEPDFGAKQTGAKEVTINFGTAVDAEKAEFVVKNGTITRAVDDVNFAENKKSAVIKLTTKLTAGESTVTVSKATTEPVVAKFNAEAEKVTDIKFASDKLALEETAAGAPDLKKASTTYTIVNQFGEDVTKSAGGTLNFFAAKVDSTATPSNGKLTVALGSTGQFMYGETVQVTATLNMSSYIVQKQQVFTVSQPSMLDDVKIIGLYHATNKELQSNFGKDEFFILVDAFDQYGNTVGLEKFKKGAYALAQNPLMFTVDIKESVENKGPQNNKLALKLIPASNTTFVQEGVNKVTINTLYGGKSDSIEIPFKKAATLTTFQLEAPDNVVTKGKEFEIPFSAYDQNGVQITKHDDIVDLVDVSIPGATVGFKKNYVTKGTKLIAKIPNAGTSIAVSNVKGTTNTSQIQINVVEAGKPTAVAGVKKDFVKSVVLGQKLTLKLSDIVFHDEYGREIKLADLTSNGANPYTVEVASGNTDVATVSKSTLSPLTATTDELTITALKKGSANLNLVLKNASNEISSHTSTVIQVVDESNIDLSTAEIEVSDRIYGGPAIADKDYAAAVKVTAKTTSGDKITIPSSEYVVQATAQLVVTDPATSADSFTVKAVELGSNDAANVTAGIRVIFKANGEEKPKDVTVSKETPVATTFKAESVKDGIQVTADGVVKASLSSQFLNVDEIIKTLTIKDQYGVELKLDVLADKSQIDFAVTQIDGFKLTKSNGNLGTNNGITQSTVAEDQASLGDSYVITFTSKANFKNIKLTVVADSN
ncbi:S-layer homology domain-containing protein [Paenibacillus yanchengensis]|uniref:S-layer homology domain-containing protein n=1 Tax=Paenibacillus yanchengensis TaxID=2035833 RepID=A0ABW4YND3_9BACL